MSSVPLPWRHGVQDGTALFHTASDLWDHADRVDGEGFLISPPMRLPRWALTEKTTVAQLAQREWVTQNQTPTWESVKRLWKAGMHTVHPISSVPVDTAPKFEGDSSYCIPEWLVNRFNPATLSDDIPMKNVERLRTLTEAFVDHLYQDLHSAVVTIVGSQIQTQTQTQTQTQKNEAQQIQDTDTQQLDSISDSDSDSDSDGDDGDNPFLDRPPPPPRPPCVQEKKHSEQKTIIATALNRLELLQRQAVHEGWLKKNSGMVRSIRLPSDLKGDNCFQQQLTVSVREKWFPAIKVQYDQPSINTMSGNHRAVKITTRVTIFFRARAGCVGKWPIWTLDFMQDQGRTEISKYCLKRWKTDDGFKYLWRTDYNTKKAPQRLKQKKQKQEGSGSDGMMLAPEWQHETLYSVQSEQAPKLPQRYKFLQEGCYSIPQKKPDSPPWHMCIAANQGYSVLHHFHGRTDGVQTVCQQEDCIDLMPLNWDKQADDDVLLMVGEMGTTYGTGDYIAVFGDANDDTKHRDRVWFMKITGQSVVHTVQGVWLEKSTEKTGDPEKIFYKQSEKGSVNVSQVLAKVTMPPGQLSITVKNFKILDEAAAAHEAAEAQAEAPSTGG